MKPINIIVLVIVLFLVSGCTEQKFLVPDSTEQIVTLSPHLSTEWRISHEASTSDCSQITGCIQRSTSKYELLRGYYNTIILDVEAMKFDSVSAEDYYAKEVTSIEEKRGYTEIGVPNGCFAYRKNARSNAICIDEEYVFTIKTTGTNSDLEEDTIKSILSIYK